MHATLCDVITDIVQNAIEAGATEIDLLLETTPERVFVKVKDNGKGMDKETVQRALDPFYSEPGKHDSRRVGLGLPLLFQMTEQTGGRADIDSTPGVGTTVTFSCDRSHPDTPPLGSLPMTLVAVMSYPGKFDLRLDRRVPDGGYEVSRSELEAALGNLEEATCLILARQFFESQEDELH